MSNKSPEVTPFKARTPVAEAEAIMCALEEIYYELTDNKSSFMEYFKEMHENEATDGVKFAAYFNYMLEEAPEELEGYMPFYGIEISCAYCIQAWRQYKANNNQSTDLIWTYLSEANFWRYFVKYLILSDQDEKNILKSNASKAAKARLKNDPKQKVLDEIKLEFHKLEIERFKKYGFTAQFVKEMMDKYPIIENQKTVENLVAKLKKR
jgi:hypothetical protein